jgi:acyl-CoA hydrolase/GNAT superfamily N-acetyltransferase
VAETARQDLLQRRHFNSVIGRATIGETSSREKQVMNERWQETYAGKIATPPEAVAGIRNGDRVFIGSGAAEPQQLVAALADRRRALAGTEVVHIMTLGVAPYVAPELEEGFRHNAFFIGANTREAVSECRADYTPMFLSEIPALLRSGRGQLDVALIQTSPPDEHGFMSYGVSVDIVKAAAESAGRVVAQVNPRMPRVLGDSFIHVSHVDALVPFEEDILEASHGAPDEVALRIGRRIADLVEDGSTLQMGIGTIPDAVLACLGDKRDLGVHTEMFSDGVIPLVEQGVINGARKPLHRGKIVTSFVLGSRRLYEWVHDNPMIEFHPTEHTNDPFTIGRHDRMVAINSALEVDLTGQVCADSIGEYFYSGIGGQVDFIRGASRAPRGKPIIALPATARDGTMSRIVPALKPGAGVVTSRGDVHYIVTEYGVADLHGRSIRERALALIHIAHPDFRESLMDEARRRRLVPPDQVAVVDVGTEARDALASRLRTKDGLELTMRPAEPTDEDRLADAFYGLSEETVHRRFHAPLRSMPRSRLREAVSFDPKTSMMLVVVDNRDGEDRIVAAGRYDRDPATNAAEVAFTVTDEWQDRGIGTRLVTRLVELAREQGIAEFTAEVLATNGRMLHVFHRSAPAPVESTLDAGVYHVRFALDAAAVPGDVVEVPGETVGAV